MQEISSLLQDLGLNQKEAQVYLGLLQLGQTSVLALARRTGLKRPTIYLVLDELIRKGYAATVPREKKKIFIALPPDRLQERFTKTQEALASALPQLWALYTIKSARPTVRLFEGWRALDQIYQEITTSGEREILSFYSPEVTSKKFAESFMYFIKLLKSHPEARSRELIFLTDPQHFYLQAVKKLPNHDARFVSEKYRFFTDNIIWLNTIAIFSLEKEFAVVIESKDVVDSFRSLFELAWKSAI